MARQRVYPSWLPPNPRERERLLIIRRWQTVVILWMATLFPAGWLAMLLAGSAETIAALTVGWIAAGILLSRRVSALECPRCGDRFCDAGAAPYWNGLFIRRCGNCGVSLKPPVDD